MKRAILSSVGKGLKARNLESLGFYLRTLIDNNRNWKRMVKSTSMWLNEGSYRMLNGGFRQLVNHMHDARQKDLLGQ